MRELVVLGLEVHAAMPAGGPLSNLYRQAGITVHETNFDLPIRRPWRWRALFAQLHRLVDDLAPDLVHSHFVGTTLTMRLGLGRRSRTPRVFQVPGPLHLEHRLFRDLELATAGPCDHWIGSCQLTCETYRRSRVPDDRLHLAYYGQDVDPFLHSTPGRLRAELGIRRDQLLIGMVAFMYAPKRYLGQTRGLKGHEDLIDAVALCVEQGVDVRVVMVGGRWDRATSYERKVREYGRRICGDRVIFLGTRQDVPELYADFDVAVHPSHSENVGGAIESLLAGVPTITTNIGGFPDVVREAETGWLVPPKSPRQLAQVIQHVLSDPVGAKDVALRGRALACQMFDVRATARDTLRIYERVVSHRSQATSSGIGTM